ncbi:MAG: DUF4160 domain-containing protein [Roseiarcus sp.]
MVSVFNSRRRCRVAVNSNDHPPPHVHVFGKGCEARFLLECEAGAVALWDFDGVWNRSHLNELGAEIADQLAACCAAWRRIHG